MKRILHYVIAVALFVNGGAVACNAGQQVNWSLTSHKKEREIVKEILKEDIKEAKTISNEPVKIAIDTIDINQDGVKEIFVSIEHQYFCGDDGCTILIFKKSKSNKWVRILYVIMQDIKISDQKTNGYNNMIIDENSVMKWNGSKYKGADTK